MMRRILHRLRSDRRGSVAIETALVTPMLVMMSVGGFQVSRMVARQAELQSAAAEASSIAIASAPDTAEKRTTLASVIRTSTGLGTNDVTVTAKYRCGSTTTLVDSTSGCGSAKVSKYVKIQLTQTYVPIWHKFGVGSSLRYSVTRYVMYAQS